jgi:excisionase family DNA binding protein
MNHGLEVASTQFFDNSIAKLADQEWLTATEAATYLRVSVGTLRNLTSNGGIPYYKLGRRVRYRSEDLRNLLLLNKRGKYNGLQ